MSDTRTLLNCEVSVLHRLYAFKIKFVEYILKFVDAYID